MFPTYSNCIKECDLFHAVADFFKFGLVCQGLLLKSEKNKVFNF